MLATGAAKLRYLVATHDQPLRHLGTLLVLAGVVDIVLTMLFPPTMAVTAVTDRSVVETTTNTTAIVEGDHAMYEDGETLTNEPVYIRSVAPNVTVTATTRAPPDGIAVDHQVSIVYEASSPVDGVFRQQEHVLTATTATIETEGETVESAVTLQVADIAATLTRMRDEIGDAGSVNAYLRVETGYAGSGYEGSFEDRDELTVGADAYRIPPLSTAEEHRTTTSNVVPAAGSVFQVSIPVIGPLIVPHAGPLFVGLFGLGVGVIGAVRHGSSEFDADQELVRIHRLRYSEWISSGELPGTLAAYPLIVPMESLEGVVDIAIDSGTRVIHDADQDCYVVIADMALYVFYPDSADGFVFDNEPQEMADER